MLGWLGRVVAWLAILGIGAVITVSVLIPRVGGATPYTVLTGSMRPAMPPGTLVVAKAESVDQIGVGDVVTYQLESGEPAVVTHRVVSMADQPNGDPIFRTQGDANNVPDQKWVRPVQIKGVKWYAVPYLGYVNNALTGSQRQTAVYLVSAALIGYAAYLFAGALRERSRQEEDVSQ